MGKYRIVRARPKGTGNHLNSQFNVYEHRIKNGKPVWTPIGWKTIYDVSAWLNAGDQVLTGKVEGTTMHHGDAVELELRIAHNGTNYKLGDMPDC